MSVFEPAAVASGILHCGSMGSQFKLKLQKSQKFAFGFFLGLVFFFQVGAKYGCSFELICYFQ